MSAPEEKPVSHRFRRYFTRRLAASLGLTALACPVMYACSSTIIVEEGQGGSSQGGASQTGAVGQNGSGVTTSNGQVTVTTVSSGTSMCTETTTTGGGPDPRYRYSRCLDDDNKLPCPTDPEVVDDAIRRRLQDECCITGESCEELDSVVCGPFVTAEGSCCFEIESRETWCSVPGRPFICEGTARLAEASMRSDWLVEESDMAAAIDALSVHHLSEEERLALAAKWEESALAEHASIASFARFALQLMALGAPADLVRAAQGAALDEVRHAQLCFAVASRYAGRSIGPGPLPMPAGAATKVTLASLARSTVEQGCINETLSTLKAQAEREATTEPLIRSLLGRIVADETRHAELAWRTVAWAARVDADAKRAARDAFARAQHGDAPSMVFVVQPLAAAMLDAA